MGEIQNVGEYFDWLCEFVCTEFQESRYSRLLFYLHSIEFYYILPMDENRMSLGEYLQDLYFSENLISSGEPFKKSNSRKSTTILELMVGLSLKCEEIMSDIEMDDRTSYWFWEMMRSLGLEDMTNDLYDEDEVERIIYRFLDREYDHNGKGGLFTIPGVREDMRNVEIWYQMNWYLQTQ